MGIMKGQENEKLFLPERDYIRDKSRLPQEKVCGSGKRVSIKEAARVH